MNNKQKLNLPFGFPRQKEKLNYKEIKEMVKDLQ